MQINNINQTNVNRKVDKHFYQFENTKTPKVVNEQIEEEWPWMLKDK